MIFEEYLTSRAVKLELLVVSQSGMPKRASFAQARLSPELVLVYAATFFECATSLRRSFSGRRCPIVVCVPVGIVISHKL